MMRLFSIAIFARSSISAPRGTYIDAIDDPDIDSSLSHLRKNGAIVNSPHFENGIVKIQCGNEGSLSAQEKSAVKMFLVPGIEHPPAAGEEETYAQTFLRTGASANQRRRLNSKYRSTKHVSSQVNLCERLFSSGRLVMSYLRSHMNPDSLEQVLFLKVNKDYWLDAKIIDDVMVKEKLRVTAEAQAVAATAAAVAAAQDDENDD